MGYIGSLETDALSRKTGVSDDLAAGVRISHTLGRPPGYTSSSFSGVLSHQEVAIRA
jgi:hypothetical protein